MQRYLAPAGTSTSKTSKWHPWRHSLAQARRLMEVLERYDTYDEVLAHLPDLELAA
jgi:hypothetical protein